MFQIVKIQFIIEGKNNQFKLLTFYVIKCQKIPMKLFPKIILMPCVGFA